ncbi:glycoside hydrolase family 15 protein [Acuticoccus kandeliae]|uniref:glycoside hydrolase family 15 protein n=1 Tax=Acuticoccus kandeliae TaxID=2073160 RepID=UPI000D3E174A|nr:glycoside hydrolase family 15 protein [Acuticoccus kandeliae]
MTLADWIAAQRVHAKAGLLRAISATDILRERPALGDRIRPVRGSVVASPVLGDYDPEPDYFFHWLRDAGIVLDCVRILDEAGDGAADWGAMLADAVAFDEALLALDGRRVAQGAWRAGVRADMVQHVRDAEDLAAITGTRVPGDVRFNPDATLDIKRWGRPQYDGPALRALSLARWLEGPRGPDGPVREAAVRVIAAYLGAVLAHLDTPSFDIWEEVAGAHYYTRLAQSAAFVAAAACLPDHPNAAGWDAAAARLDARLADHWSPALGIILARLDGEGPAEARADAAVLLAIIHAGRAAGPHSVLDPHGAQTAAVLETLFAERYAINRDRPTGEGVAFGRYRDDIYYSGGAFFMTTLAAAEYAYRRAAALPLAGAPDGASLWDDPRALFAWGDGILATVRRHTPADGTMAEQFDQTTGAPSSAKDLAWSHAALLTATDHREKAARALSF